MKKKRQKLEEERKETKLLMGNGFWLVLVFESL